MKRKGKKGDRAWRLETPARMGILRPARYAHYEPNTAEDGKRYITPGKSAKPDVRNPLKEIPDIVPDALNAGMLMTGRKPEAEAEKAVMEFIARYGLPGRTVTGHRACAGTAGRCSRAAGPTPPFAARGAGISTMSARAGERIGRTEVTRNERGTGTDPV